MSLIPIISAATEQDWAACCCMCLQVREVRCHYSTATGPCAARSMAQQLWAGEEYVLQIDAHMRFVQVSQLTTMMGRPLT